jgi:hypothetical protein
VEQVVSRRGEEQTLGSGSKDSQHNLPSFSSFPLRKIKMRLDPSLLSKWRVGEDIAQSSDLVLHVPLCPEVPLAYLLGLED